MLRSNVDGKGVWGRYMDICICMAESLYYSPQTTTTLLVGYIPTQNKKVKMLYNFQKMDIQIILFFSKDNAQQLQQKF